MATQDLATFGDVMEVIDYIESEMPQSILIEVVVQEIGEYVDSVNIAFDVKTSSRTSERITYHLCSEDLNNGNWETSSFEDFEEKYLYYQF
jgi:hypothetical protein